MTFHWLFFRAVPIQSSKSCDSLLTSSPSPSGESADRKLSLPIKTINLDTPMFVPDIEEVRPSPVVSRRGYLNFLEDNTNGWIKKWVVCDLDPNYWKKEKKMNYSLNCFFSLHLGFMPEILEAFYKYEKSSVVSFPICWQIT